MKEIMLPMTEGEFQKYLSKIEEKVQQEKDNGLGYVSITCQLAKEVSSEDVRCVFTSDQLRRIFELAK